MPISEALREHPELVRKYLGSVRAGVGQFLRNAHSAVFSDGSFVYVCRRACAAPMVRFFARRLFERDADRTRQAVRF